jgi:hypothetical protein
VLSSEIENIKDQGFQGTWEEAHEFHFGHVEFEVLLHIK